MRRLLQLLFRHGGFVTFVVVETLCFLMMLSINKQKQEIYAHTTGIYSGGLMERQRRIEGYFNLEKKVDSLVQENKQLQQRLTEALNVRIPYRDTFLVVNIDSIQEKDTSFIKRETFPQYHFITARVISNSVNSMNNWLVLNRGSNDGLKADMGVMTPRGLVGIVRHVGSNFALAMSILHREVKISVKVKLKNYKGNEKPLGSLVWEGGDPNIMTLKFIPVHFGMKPNDLVVTSGYSEFFPREVPVGIVKEVAEDPDNSYFSIAKVTLSHDLSAVDYVYVVDNIFSSELKSVKQIAEHEQ